MSDRIAALRAGAGRVLAGDEHLWALAFVALALVVRLPLLVNDYDAASTPDTGLYIQIAEELLAGNGFIETYRTPGYPLFIAVVSLLPGPTIDAVTVLQHLLGAALAGAVFLITRRYFGSIAALLAATLTALAPVMMIVEHWVMADFLFGVAMLAAVVALIEGALPERPSLPTLALAGALLGIATYVKPSGQALLLAAPLVLAFATRSWRHTARGSLVAVAAMAAVLVPWVVHNAVRYDSPLISTQGAWTRAIDQEHYPIPTDSEEGRMAKRAYDRYIDRYSPSEAETTESAGYVFDALLERGMSLHEATRIQAELALEAIANHPRDYAIGTARNVKDYARLNQNLGFAEFFGERQLDHALVDGSAAVTTASWRVAQVLSHLLTFGLLASPVLLFVGPRRSRVAAFAFLVVWAGIAVSGSLAADVLPRYTAQIAPLQWILQAAATVAIVGMAIEYLRRRRDRRSAT